MSESEQGLPATGPMALKPIRRRITLATSNKKKMMEITTNTISMTGRARSSKRLSPE